MIKKILFLLIAVEIIYIFYNQSVTKDLQNLEHQSQFLVRKLQEEKTDIPQENKLESTKFLLKEINISNSESTVLQFGWDKSCLQLLTGYTPGKGCIPNSPFIISNENSLKLTSNLQESAGQHVQIKIVNDAREQKLYNKLMLGAGIGVGVPHLPKVSASLQYQHSTQKSNTHNTFGWNLHGKNNKNVKFVDLHEDFNKNNLQLTQQAQHLLQSDPQKFIDTYGHLCILGYTEHSEIEGAYKMKSNSKQIIQDYKTTFTLGMKIGALSPKLKSTFEIKKKKYSRSIEEKYYLSNTGGILDIDKLEDFTQLEQILENWAKGDQLRAKGIAVPWIMIPEIGKIYANLDLEKKLVFFGQDSLWDLRHPEIIEEKENIILLQQDIDIFMEEYENYLNDDELDEILDFQLQEIDYALLQIENINQAEKNLLSKFDNIYSWMSYLRISSTDLAIQWRKLKINILNKIACNGHCQYEPEYNSSYAYLKQLIQENNDIVTHLNNSFSTIHQYYQTNNASFHQYNSANNMLTATHSTKCPLGEIVIGGGCRVNHLTKKYFISGMQTDITNNEMKCYASTFSTNNTIAEEILTAYAICQIL